VTRAKQIPTTSTGKFERLVFVNDRYRVQPRGHAVPPFRVTTAAGFLAPAAAAPARG
jgi:hypothetical protein